jgi:hypothetical protein
MMKQLNAEPRDELVDVMTILGTKKKVTQAITEVVEE